MSLIIRIASPIEVAWKPMFPMGPTRSSTVICRPANLSKSSPSTFLDDASGISLDGTRIASVTEDGSVSPLLEETMVAIDNSKKEIERGLPVRKGQK